MDISDETERRPLNISETVMTFAEEYSGYAEDSSIAVSADIQKNITVYGDEKLFEKALRNIIGNAVSHTPDGGIVRVTLTNGSEATLVVENSPAHISEEHLPHLFEAFYRADKSSEHGSGLGLYISRMIFEKYNIDYKIENTADGVRFTVKFGNSTQKTH